MCGEMDETVAKWSSSGVQWTRANKECTLKGGWAGVDGSVGGSQTPHGPAQTLPSFFLQSIIIHW